ncbi:MAG: transglutaminase family protein [Acidimicrobiia bacterium]
MWEAAAIHILVGCTFLFEAEWDTHAVVMVEPHSTLVDEISQSQFSITGDRASTVYLDSFGNRCRRVDIAAGVTQIDFRAVVVGHDDPASGQEHLIEIAPGHLPADALTYLLPSRFCESDQIADVAFGQFGHLPTGWSRVQAISTWVHDAVHFDYANASPMHTAMSVLATRTGVCRDFTHLGIALLRALNIPARYVFGYLPDIGVESTGAPADFCAWIEVYLGDGWHTVDPRNNTRRFGRVVIGRGRDAADVAMITTFGHVELTSMSVVAEASY